MFRAQITICKFLTAIALMFALVSSGFAHTGYRSAMSADLAAYVAAGGALNDICGGSGEQNSTVGQKCEACRLIGAALVPRACVAVPMILTDQTRVLSFVAKRLHHDRPLDPTRLTRAPPQV